MVGTKTREYRWAIPSVMVFNTVEIASSYIICNTMLAPKHLHKIVGTHDLCGQHSLCHPNSFTIPFRRVLTASPFRFFDASKLNVRRKGHRVVHSICLDVCCCRFKKADGGKLYALNLKPFQICPNV